MTCGKKKLKRASGLTLMELLVTMTLLMIIITPIMGMFVQGSRTTMASNNLAAASLTAQLRMEELVGISRLELCDFTISSFTGDPEGTITWNSPPNDGYNGFRVTAEVTFNYEAADMENVGNLRKYKELAQATVTVFDLNTGNELCSQTNILNVAAYSDEGGTP